MTRPPTTIAVREATVGPLSGTSEVSDRRHLDLGRLDAERLGGEHREDRLGALADLRARDEHAHDAVVSELDAGDAREMDLAPAREARAVPGQGEPDARRASGRGSRPRRSERRARLGPSSRTRSYSEASTGALEDLGRTHALAQDLAGGRDAALAIHPALAERRR